MKYISRILFVLAVMLCGAGTAQAATDDLNILTTGVTGATVTAYVSTSEPTASYSASGTAATTVQHGQYLVLKVTPTDGKWLYNEMLEVQVAGGPGGALVRTRGLVVAENPTALSTNPANLADGTGYYYYLIPDDCTSANGYKNVVVTGAAVSKIDLSSASIDATGKVITASADGWTATITLDEVKWTYDASPHGPAISAFTLTNGTKTFASPEVQADKTKQVSISGEQTNAGNYNATLSAVTGATRGCFLNSLDVPFSIAKRPITVSVDDDSKVYNGSEQSGKTAYTFENLVSGHTATITYMPAKGTLPDTYDNGSFGEDLLVKAGDGTDVTANYSLTTKTAGKLTITSLAPGSKYAITVVAKSSTGNVYDGTAKSVSGFETLEFTVEGNTYTVSGLTTSDPSSTDVATLTNAISGAAVVTDAAGNDVTSQFTVTTTDGTLEIVKRDITVSVADKSLEYNGSEQSGNTEYSFTNVVDGQTATITYNPAKGTTAGIYDNGSYADDLKVVSGGTDVTSNYNLKTKTAGKLTITDPVGPVGPVVTSVVVTITGHNSTAVYDGTEHSVSGYEVEISDPLYKESDFTFSGTAAAARTIAGTTNMGLAASQFTNTNANFSVTFNVTDGFVTISQKGVNDNPDGTKGESQVSIVIDPTSFVYNGKDQKPTTITVKDGSNVISSDEYTVSYQQGTTTVTESKDVDTYTVVIKDNPGGNYTVSGRKDYDITKADPTLTAPTAKTGLEYNGSAQELVNAGTVTGGTLYYKVDDGAYSTDLPTGTAAKSYTVYYKVTGDKNHNDIAQQTVGVTIASADAVLAYADVTKTYGDADFTVTPTKKESDGAITLTSDHPEIVDVVSGNTLTIKATGTAHITANQAASGSYMAETATFTVTVNPKGVNDNPDGTKGESQVTIVIDPTSFVYNGKDQKPTTITVKDGDSVIPVGEYAVSYQQGTTTVKETKEVGTYTVVITDNAGGNYVVSGRKDYKIIPADAKLVYDDVTKTFGDADFTVTSTKKESDGAITLTSDHPEIVDVVSGSTLTIKATGVAHITANQEASGSYTAETATFTVTVNPKGVNDNPDGTKGESQVTIVIDPTSFVYNGEDQKPTTITVKDGDSVIPVGEYTVSYQQGTTTVKETKDVGTYTVVITDNAGGNYTVSGRKDYSITQKPLTITAKAKTISYGSEGSNNGVTYSGFVEGENETTEGVFSGTLTYQYNKQEDGQGAAYTKDSPVGTYYIIPGGLTSKNYAITFKAGVLTVADKVVVIGDPDDASADATISLNQTEFIYNGKDQKPEVTITLKDGNKVIPASEYVVKYKDAEGKELKETKDAGTYTLEITSKEGADYAFSGKTTINYTIKPKTLTVTAIAQTKNVGQKDPEFTYTSVGLVEGEQNVFSGALTRNEGEEAGTYAILLGTLSAGKNYAIVYYGANLTIIAPDPVIPTPPEETLYNIYVVKSDGGVVHTTHTQAKQGQQVNMVVYPDKDYELSSLIVFNNSTHQEVAVGVTYDENENLLKSFYMPAADVTVVATFVKPSEEHEQNIFILNNLYGEVVSNLLYAAQGQQVNLETRIKNGYKNTILDELFVINDKGEQLQLFYIEDPIEGPVHFFFMKGEKAYVYNTFKGTNAITDDTKSLRLDGYLMYLLGEQYCDFLKTNEGVEDVQLAMTFLANILANFTPDGELSVDQGPEDMLMAVLNLLEGWKIKIDFTGIIQLLNPEILGLGNGATLESGQIYELLAPGNLKLLLNSSYGPLLIKAITVIAPEENPTAINGLKAGGATGDTYDLRGRKVDTNTLRKGIYIRDGRKFVIK